MTYSELIAERLEQDPSILDHAINTAQAWLANNHSTPHRLTAWLELLEAARSDSSSFAKVLYLLRSPDEDAAHWRSFQPFAGILSREERRRASDLCTFRH